MTRKSKVWIFVVMVGVLVAVGVVPKADAHKPKHAKGFVYVPAQCPPQKTVVHHYFLYKPYWYPPPPPRHVHVYHYYKPCYPVCGYYPTPHGPYVGGYVGDVGWSLFFETGGRW